MQLPREKIHVLGTHEALAILGAPAPHTEHQPPVVKGVGFCHTSHEIPKKLASLHLGERGHRFEQPYIFVEPLVSQAMLTYMALSMRDLGPGCPTQVRTRM